MKLTDVKFVNADKTELVVGLIFSLKKFTPSKIKGWSECLNNNMNTHNMLVCKLFGYNKYERKL